MQYSSVGDRPKGARVSAGSTLSEKKVIQSQSLKNGSILYEDSELRNEVTVSFPIEGIFQNIFAF